MGDELWLIKGITAMNVLTICHFLQFDLYKVGAPVSVCFVLGNTVFTDMPTNIFKWTKFVVF